MAAGGTERVIAPRAVAAEITKLSEAAYPEECCGLIVGTRDALGARRVRRLAPSPNVTTGDKTRAFEVDPGLIARLHRELRGTDEEILGVYHSHPDGPAAPSARDAAHAYDPDYVWLIAAVAHGQCREIGCYLRLGDDEEAGFRRLSLRLD